MTSAAVAVASDDAAEAASVAITACTVTAFKYESWFELPEPPAPR